MKQGEKISNLENASQNLTHLTLTICKRTLKRIYKSIWSGELYKEQPFVMGIPASEVYEGASAELVLIQGIVDVYWIEDDMLVLLDYKTDRVCAKEQLKERYQVQLDLYAKALQKATGKKLKEKLIYSFSLQEVVRV